MDVNMQMKAGSLKELYKITEGSNPRLHLSLEIRYDEEMKLDDDAVIHLHDLGDVSRIYRASERMTEEEKHRAGITDLLKSNSHISQPSAYNPVKNKEELRELFRILPNLANPPVFSIRGPMYSMYVYGNVKNSGVMVGVSWEDFAAVAAEFWADEQHGEDKGDAEQVRR